MAAAGRRLLRSFAGGEITPEMFGRIDLDKMQTGLAKAENFEILPHGPARNRSGYQWVNEVKDSTKRVRVIPFAYSAEQTAVLEVGDGYVRIHTQGATLLSATQAVTAVSTAASCVVTYAGADPANGQVLFLDDLEDLPTLQRRFVVVSAVNAGANTFVPLSLAGDPISTVGAAYTSGGTMAPVYEIATPWAEASLFDLHYTQSADVLTVVHPSYASSELRRLGATNWQVASIVFEPGIDAPAAPTVATGGPGGGTPVDQFYVTTAISIDTLEESEASASSAAANIDLGVAGNYVDVTPAAVTGALRYNVYKLKTGGLFGYIGQSDGSVFRDDNIVPDISQTPPEAMDPFVGAGNYPSTVTYIEQRRVFAATDNRPQTIWTTRSATESNISQSVPLRDDDSIVLPLKAAQQNRIRHLLPLGDLLAFTVGGEFRIYAANSDALTPTSAKPKAQSYVGASNVQPALAENAVLYAQASGSHMREFAYGGEGLNGATYSNLDISILAPHLFDGFTVVDMAFSRTSTCPILWVVRSDGMLLGMTYVPGQNVRAWHRHTTSGFFESVCCVAESGEDVLYAVIRREVDGRSVRYIERLHTRQFTDQADAFFVDSGLTYQGAPTTVITGGWHLEGRDVVALADGAVVEGLTFINGRLTPDLPQAASTVHVGLAITAVLETLPLSYQADEAFGQGVAKNVNKAHLRVSRSGAMQVGPTGGRLVEAKRRTTESYGVAPALRTGWDHLNVAPEWTDDAGVTVRMTQPLPLTVLAMVLEVSAGG
jgi:hypothetical protein